MSLSVGTKSVLFGVHQCFWHPLTVLLAFRRVHKRWPALWELVGIVCHDTFGYWGKTDMDGPSGINHPYLGAEVAGRVVDLFSKQKGWQVREFCLYHSSTLAKICGAESSSLYLPDKVSILMEPRWWYLFRARLSGEIHEYIKNSPHKDEATWYLYYRASVARKLKTYEKNSSN